MDNQKTKLALSVSGAISLGSYQAGVIYEIFDLMKKLGDKAGFTIDVITGASAGSVNSAILALAMMYDPQLIEFTKRIWLEGLDISVLLEKVDDPWESLLSNKVILKLKSDILDAIQGSSCVPAAYFPDKVKIGLTLANLSGIPYPVQFGNIKEKFKLTTFADWYTVELKKGDRSGKALQEIDRMLDIAIASASFPFAFPAQRLKRRCKEYEHAALDPTPSGEFEFVYVDGGIFNNEPINRATELAAPLDVDGTSRIYILVDPSPPEAAAPFLGLNMLAVGERLVPAVLTEAHFRDWYHAAKVNQRIEWKQNLIESLLLQSRAKTTPLGFVAPDAAFNQSLSEIAEKIAQFKAAKAKKDKAAYLETNLGRITKTLNSNISFASGGNQGATQEHLAKFIFVLENIAGLREKKILDLRLITPPQKGMLAGDFLISFGGFFSSEFRKHDFNIGRSVARDFVRNPKGEGGMEADLSGFPLDDAAYDQNLNFVTIKDAPMKHRIALRDNVLDKVDGLVDSLFLKQRVGFRAGILRRVIGGAALIFAAFVSWRWLARKATRAFLAGYLNKRLEIE